MAETHPNFQRAARTASRRVETLLLDMLVSGQLGEVAVVVSWSQLEPIKRITERDTTVKIGRGRLEQLTSTE